MRKSKKNITKKKFYKTKKNKCAVTDEVRRLRSVIKYLKTHKATKKNKTH